ncbi:aminopeptidase NAALADL1 [Osmerus eperlanus]|uniref:aminopeptidase NAALADL1 n=1 Tax=Osmerus eperlanus TaxID=29151 RepID=UPI002E0D6D61
MRQSPTQPCLCDSEGSGWGAVCVAVTQAVGILLGHQQSDSTPSWVQDLSRDVDEDLIQRFISEVDNMEIQENLRELTKVPHMATTEGDRATVQYMLSRWQDPDTGLDHTRVHLSFPDPNNPNTVTVG